jgi:hypothetical protein
LDYELTPNSICKGRLEGKAPHGTTYDKQEGLVLNLGNISDINRGHFDADIRDIVKVKIIHGFWKNQDERRIALLVYTIV